MILTCPQCATRYKASDSAFLPSGRKVRCAKCGHSWHQAPPQAEALVEPAAEPEIVEAAPPPPPAEPAPEPVAEPAPSPEPEPAPEPVPPPQPEPEPAPPPPPPPRPRPMAEPMRPMAYVPPPKARIEARAEPKPEAKPDAKTKSLRARTFPPKKRLAALGGWAGFAVVVLAIGWGLIGFRQNVALAWPRAASFYSALGLTVNASGLAFSDVRYAREHEDNGTVLAVRGTLVNISGRTRTVPPISATLTNTSGRELYHWEFRPEVTALKAGQRVKFLTRISSPPDAARHLTLEFTDAKG